MKRITLTHFEQWHQQKDRKTRKDSCTERPNDRANLKWMHSLANSEEKKIFHRMRHHRSISKFAGWKNEWMVLTAYTIYCFVMYTISENQSTIHRWHTEFQWAHNATAAFYYYTEFAWLISNCNIRSDCQNILYVYWILHKYIRCRIR